MPTALIGLPAFSDSAFTNLRFADSRASASFNSASARSAGVVALHTGKAAAAAATAASTSARPLCGTVPSTSRVDGSSTVMVFPDFAATDLPLMICFHARISTLLQFCPERGSP